MQPRRTICFGSWRSRLYGTRELVLTSCAPPSSICAPGDTSPRSSSPTCCNAINYISGMRTSRRWSVKGSCGRGTRRPRTVPTRHTRPSSVMKRSHKHQDGVRDGMADLPAPIEGQALIYATEDGAVRVEVLLDDERLKQGVRFGKDYFDELLERVREIRASERRFYLKITDIYEQCSIDYQKDAEITQTFFKTVQNKLHWAITGMTAAEIIAARADADEPHMGLTMWKKAPDGKVLKSDVAVAKNYLAEDEIKALERIVSMYVDYAEDQAARHRPMRMADWVEKLDGFLSFNEYEILTNAGEVSAAVARELAEGEYERFRVDQDRDYEGDFEREAKRLAERAEPGQSGET